MDTISITLTGILWNSPRPFETRNGKPGVSLWLEVPLPPRGFKDEGTSRYLKVLAFDTLAVHVTESVGKGDRVTVRADDLRAEHWTVKDSQDGEVRSCCTIIARDISSSLLHDNLTTGAAARRAGHAAGETSGARVSTDDLPAAEQADLRVLAGVTIQPHDA